MKNDKDVVMQGRTPDRTEGKTGSTQALMGWIGGKRLLRKTIAEFVPEQDLPMKERKLKTYVEVFGGMAWMLLFKPRWFRNEVYNDANGEIVNLFNVVRCHPEEFCRQFELLPNSQELFDYYNRAVHLTDVQRAAATYIKYAWSFSSNGKEYAARPGSREGLMKRVLKLSDRIERVAILNVSYEKLITRFDKESAFLYLDPPYFEFEYLYDAKFTSDDHVALRDLLAKSKAKWLLSYNDCPKVRELYKGFRIEEVTTTYSALGGENGRKASELLIMNY